MKFTDLHRTTRWTPLELISVLCKHKELTFNLTRRAIVNRYKGSFLGLAWSFLNPVIMLTIYTFIFSVVFKAKWGTGSNESKMDFAIILFVGLIVHAIFAECINSAATLIQSNVSYVKRVVFPLEILPLVSLLTAIFHGIISLMVLLLVFVITYGKLYLTVFLAPIVFLPLAAGTLGVAWIIAALGVYIRDIGQTTIVITTVMLFVSPVFFSVSALPHTFQKWIYFNPLSFIIEEMRAVVIWGNLPNWTGLGVYYVISFLVLWSGFWIFQKMRKGFSDVL